MSSQLHQHMITEPTRNDTVMHDGLIWLVLKVRAPATTKVWSWPFLKLLELLRGWTDLDSCFDSIRGQGAGAFEIPFLEDLFSSC